MSAEETGFPHACSLIEARTEHLHKDKKEGPAATVRYFISSLSVEETTAKRFAQLVRAHWNIENGSHWQRDKLWREDHHLMRQHRGAHILSTLRQISLCIHSREAMQGPLSARRISHRTQRAANRLSCALPLIIAALC